MVYQLSILYSKAYCFDNIHTLSKNILILTTKTVQHMCSYKANLISAIQYITTKSTNQPVPLIIFLQKAQSL